MSRILAHLWMKNTSEFYILFYIFCIFLHLKYIAILLFIFMYCTL